MRWLDDVKHVLPPVLLAQCPYTCLFVQEVVESEQSPTT